MIIHSHEAKPCFNKTNYPGVFWWQPQHTKAPISPQPHQKVTTIFNF